MEGGRVDGVEGSEGVEAESQRAAMVVATRRMKSGKSEQQEPFAALGEEGEGQVDQPAEQENDGKSDQEKADDLEECNLTT